MLLFYICMPSLTDHSSITRRRALSGIGGAVTLGSIPSNVTATDAPLQGFLYDPATMEILGEASAHLQRTPKNISGKVSICPDEKFRDEFVIGKRGFELNNIEPKAGYPDPVQMDGKTISRSSFEKNLPGDKMSKISVTSYSEGGVTGYYRPPGIWEKVAFGLADTNKNGSPNKLLDMIDKCRPYRIPKQTRTVTRRE